MLRGAGYTLREHVSERASSVNLRTESLTVEVDHRSPMDKR
jgi:hypothetical protein